MITRRRSYSAGKPFARYGLIPPPEGVGGRTMEGKRTRFMEPEGWRAARAARGHTKGL